MPAGIGPARHLACLEATRIRLHGGGGTAANLLAATTWRIAANAGIA